MKCLRWELEDGNLINLTEVIDYNGGKLIGFKNDHLFNLLKTKYFVDDFLIFPINKYVDKNSTVIDIGANLGYVSIYLSKLAHKVLAFEPQKEVYFQLCGNLFLNECFNVDVFNCGLFSKETGLSHSQILDGWVGTSNPKDIASVKSFGSISFEPDNEGDVKAYKLDDIMLDYDDHVDFIKIDCEGADIDVLLGAEELIKTDHPVICFEFGDSCQKFGRAFKDVEDLAKKYSYKLNQLAEGNFILE